MVRTVIVVAVVALLVAACGGDDSNAATDRNAVGTNPTTSVETIAPATSTTTAPVTTTTTSTTMPTTTTTSTTAPTTTTTAVREEPAPFTVSADVPDIDMFDAATGATVNLRTVVKGEKPLMFWFWSPF